MIIPDIKGNAELKSSLCALDESNRMPHALIITGGAPAERGALALHLSMWAVCSSSERPCGRCKNCLNAQKKEHSDIYYAKGSGKTGIYNREELSAIIRDAYVKPNQAGRKVYILEECDRKFSEISQNVFLKTLEEPPQDVLFIMTCEDDRSLLQTIRSRSTVFTLESEAGFLEESLSLARDIALNIISLSEMDLLKTTYRLSDRDKALEALDAVESILRDGLVLCVGGEPKLDPDTAEKLSLRLRKAQYLRLIEITRNAKLKIKQNVGLKLVSAWLCSQYRRTLWQR